MELFDFGIPALDKALNLTATVLLLLALGMLLIRVILRLCDRAFDRSERLAPFRTYLRSTLRAVLYILLALAVLGSIGVEITSFVALLSVAGLAVSLSLQNTLSNVAGGVMLLISKPFTVGDYVSCDGIEGAVRAVDLAYTTFTTVDNKEIFVPNSQIVTAKIVNYNALGRRRVDLTYTASYDAPTETVRTAILEAVAAFPQVTDEPAGRKTSLVSNEPGTLLSESSVRCATSPDARGARRRCSRAWSGRLPSRAGRGPAACRHARRAPCSSCRKC